MPNKSSAAIEGVRADAFHIPTDAPEADGTIAWDSTTIVVVELMASGQTGLGYTYASASTAGIVGEVLADTIKDQCALDVPARWLDMVAAVRNIGWRGIASCAISAIDVALWDLKAKLLGVPAATLLGSARRAVPIYGSGGFTGYSDQRLAEQLGRWVHDGGCRAVKMKIGSQPWRDLDRIGAARQAISDAELYIDANGTFQPKQALAIAEAAAEQGVTWFEEPVSSDDLEGLRLLRERMPAPVRVVAGEYGYDPFYFRHMLEARAVDVLQADATRCGGVTGFLKAAEIADAFGRPLSAHTAPSLHLHACAAAPRLENLEWFHDHVRIERMLFDGMPVPHDGSVSVDMSRPGLGLEFKRADAQRFAA